MSVHVDHKEKYHVYSDGLQHIADELNKLDLIIKRHIAGFRVHLEESHSHSGNQHMFISHEEIDWLLQDEDLNDNSQSQMDTLDNEIIEIDSLIAEKLENSEVQGIVLPLLHLTRLYNLSEFEVQVLIITLAPELRRKYDRIYAYLQDDITRKRASIDLVLNLLCRYEKDRWQLQNLFTKNGVLLQANLVNLIEDPNSPSGCSSLGQFLKLDPGILNFILGDDNPDSRLLDFAHLKSADDTSDFIFTDTKTSQYVSDLIDWRFESQVGPAKNLVLHLHGPLGVGKQNLALQQCKRLQCNLLYLDARRLYGDETNIEESLRLAFREAMLLQAPLYIQSVDILIHDESRNKFFISVISKLVDEYGWLTFLAGEKPWQAQHFFENSVFKDIELAMPGFLLRKQAWIKSMESKGEQLDDEIAIQLASQFHLTPGQIQTATDAINLEHSLKSHSSIDNNSELVDACRDQSNQRLRDLAVKVDALYNWNDLILPHHSQSLLKQICDQIRQQHKVFNLWGFDKKLSYGKGLSALFSGPPGTGKTMAAQVIANEIQLDLYKVDLSTVISKYIGETEKNLSHIFREAENSNSILFFDEADAIFGKRTEINDAHDRYANIEVSYLLQKMEEYDGIVILASNFRSNMDDAFMRRIRFIIEFPFPDEESRLQIWKIHFPEQAPVADDIDYDFLAKQFPIPGGNIKNIILNAAFQAAKCDTPITMDHLLEGTKHEYEKIGKLWSVDSRSKLSKKQLTG